MDLTADDYSCTDCGARATGGDVVLPQGLQANSVLLQLHFDGGEILQKYYSLAVYTGQARVPRSTSVRYRGGHSIRQQVFDVDVVEQAGWLQDNTLRTLFEANSLIKNPVHHDENYYGISALVAVTISGIIIGFFLCFLYAYIDEHRAKGWFETMPII